MFNSRNEKRKQELQNNKKEQRQDEIDKIRKIPIDSVICKIQWGCIFVSVKINPFTDNN